MMSLVLWKTAPIMRAATLCLAFGVLAGCGGGTAPGTGQTSPGAGSSGTNGGSTSSASAAHFLISDPYPPTGDQPSSFLVSCDGATPLSSPPAIDTAGARYLHFALNGLNPGPHTCDIFAADASNTVSASTSVSFTL